MTMTAVYPPMSIFSQSDDLIPPVCVYVIIPKLKHHPEPLGLCHFFFFLLPYSSNKLATQGLTDLAHKELF